MKMRESMSHPLPNPRIKRTGAKTETETKIGTAETEIGGTATTGTAGTTTVGTGTEIGEIETETGAGTEGRTEAGTGRESPTLKSLQMRLVLAFA